MIRRAFLGRVAIAMAAGTVWIADVDGQAVPRDTAAARRDSLAADSLRARADSVAADTAARADTIKAPIARAEMPALVGIGEPFRWDRAALFSSGATTVGELLERVPGATTYRPGWLASPQHTALMGDFSRVRVFYDGIEVDPLDARAGGLLDLSEVQLWTLEEVAVQRGADELRVHLRSWRVERTATNTRTDVATGDEDTNLYRAFGGKRFGRGEVVQFAAQQYGYDSRDLGLGGGDQLSLLGRLGWARRGWSVDAFAIRTSRTRDLHVRRFTTGVIPALRSVRTDAYVRAALGDPDRGSWLQLIAASLRFEEETPPSTGDEADTTRSRAQYVAAAGTSLGPLHISATGRTRVYEGVTHTTLAGRGAFETGVLALSVYGELRRSDTTWLEAAARLSPVPWLAVTGAVGRRQSGSGGPETLSARGEAGIRIGRLWTTGGVMLRDTAVLLPPPAAFDTGYVAAADPERPVGVFGTMRGRIWKDIHADAFVVRWENPGYYRPQTQARGELYVRTDWLGRFPSGNFGFLGSVAYEYRGRSAFPRADGADVTTQLRQLRTMVEIRIVDGYLFWQQQFRINSQPDIVPGFVLQRQLALYGVRWQFWN
ncbi:MAG: hypothetical protein M3373_13815 [Gemmatimonadota bacterium]|nr:hypothetical protein [Gemmatimonadota bacterium]